MQDQNVFPQGEEEMETRLWEYIDDTIDQQQKSEIQQLIEQHTAWRLKYQELLDVRQLLLNTELDQPSLRFSRNVMEEIARHQIAPATGKYINQKIIWGLAAFFIIMIVGFLIYGIGQIDWSAASNSNSSLGIDLDKVDYSKMFSNSFVNIFMMLNVILGLMLFDRWLNRKKKHFYENGIRN